MVGFILGSLVCVVFLFRGCKSFEPGGLSCSRVGADDWLAASIPSHVGGPTNPHSKMARPSGVMVRRTLGMSIFACAFAANICDLVTFSRSVKASGML